MGSRMKDYIDVESALWSRIIFVSAMGKNLDEDGSVYRPFKTLDAAVAAMTDSDVYVLVLKDSTYTVTSSVNFTDKKVHIFGECGGVEIHGDGVTPIVAFADTEPIAVSMSGVKLFPEGGATVGLSIDGGSQVGNVVRIKDGQVDGKLELTGTISTVWIEDVIADDIDTSSLVQLIDVGGLQAASRDVLNNVDPATSVQVRDHSRVVWYKTKTVEQALDELVAEVSNMGNMWGEPVDTKAELAALDYTNPDLVADKMARLCEENGAIYRYDAESTATPDGEKVINPDGNTGDGRWIKISAAVPNHDSTGPSGDGPEYNHLNDAQLQALKNVLSKGQMTVGTTYDSAAPESGEITIAHNLGTTNIVVQCFEAVGGGKFEQFIPDKVSIEDGNTVKVTWVGDVTAKISIVGMLP